jgi:hypothetical protein
VKIENDPINPAYYNNYRIEVIEILEDLVKRAPDPVLGSLQWQVLKYLARIWDKDGPLQDARKSRWYLNRLISKLEEEANYESRYKEQNNEAQ